MNSEDKNYIENSINFIKIVDYKFDRQSLLKFMAHINKNLIDYPLEDMELNSVNTYIKNNEVSKVIDFIDETIIATKDVIRDTIAGETDDLWQYIMHNAYVKWDDESGMTRNEFLNKISYYEKIAVMFGNLNYQVENGNFSQWDLNHYSGDCNTLIEFLENSNYSDKNKFIDILETFNSIKYSINELDSSDTFYDLDLETRYKEMDKLDYNSIKDSWSDYFQEYLIDNITREYMDLILDYNKDKVGI